MKDANDKETAELIPMPAKRGRPKSGNALTNAERQAKYRENHRNMQREKATSLIDYYIGRIATSSCRSDVIQATEWAYGAIALAHELGILSDDEFLQFREDKTKAWRRGLQKFP